ncbi:MAG: 4-hydroxy-tetrahydrodipicolinate synthase [Myxococcota bacterium]|nr:4-hydroxy-tetrahydrodipicolinate synthase [Myxococcota bacterium]
MKFQGLMTAIVTPMQQGSVDEAGLRDLVRKQIDSGVSGIVACGSTGEGATLTDEEQLHVIRVALEAAGGRTPLVAGVGSRSTAGAIIQAQAAEQAGAAGLLVVTPAYNKPTQAGLEAHFRAVADAVDLPICLYNVPGRTGVDLLPSTIAALAEVPSIVAIKEATGSLERAAEIRRLTGSAFALMSGDDFTSMAFIAQGGDGAISVLSNILPAPTASMLEAAATGDLQRARELNLRLLPVCRALFVESNPIPVKTAAAWLSIIPSAELRLPLTPLTEAGGDVLRAALEGVGLSPNRRPGEPSTLGPGRVPDLLDSAAPTVDLQDGSPAVP